MCTVWRVGSSIIWHNFSSYLLAKAHRVFCLGMNWESRDFLDRKCDDGGENMKWKNQGIQRQRQRGSSEDDVWTFSMHLRFKLATTALPCSLLSYVEYPTFLFWINNRVRRPVFSSDGAPLPYCLSALHAGITNLHQGVFQLFRNVRGCSLRPTSFYKR